MPNDGAQVEAEIKGLVDNKVFDERTVQFEMGEGSECGVPRGVEIAMEKMKVMIYIYVKDNSYPVHFAEK